jgi:hypothetical protein
MGKIRTQADRRKHAVFVDQFGRKWETQIEKDTMHPCTVVTPKGWREPEGCVTPEVYKSYPHVDDPFAMVIKVDEWIQALEEAQQAYEQTAANTAMFMSPDDNGSRLFRAAEDGTIFIARALRGIIGNAPAPADLVKAMKAGNKWALGLINPDTGRPYPRPKWADKFFPVVAAPKNEFPDEYEDEEDSDFEDAGDAEPEEFPDEPEDRPTDEAVEPEQEPDLDGDYGFSHLSNVTQAAPAPKAAPKKTPIPSMKPVPKPAAKKPAPKPVAKKAAPKPAPKPIPKPAPPINQD